MDTKNAPTPQRDAPSEPEPTDVEDIALADAVKRGDPKAMNTLLTKHQGRIFATCVRVLTNREMAADVAQDAMVKIIEGLGTWDRRSKLTTWLTRVTINACLSKLRREKYRRHASLDNLTQSGRSDDSRPYDPPTKTEPRQGSSVEQDRYREILTAALAAIGEEHRDILLLRDVQGLEYEHIAEVIGIPVGTVKSRLFRARATLRLAVERISGKVREDL